MWCYYDAPDDEDADWFWNDAEDFSVCDTQDARCFSCGKKIEQGATCVRFERWRKPTEEEEDQGMDYDVKIPLDPVYHCEACGEIYFNLTALDWEVDISDMRGELEQYWDMTGFDPEKWSGDFQNGNNHSGE